MSHNAAWTFEPQYVRDHCVNSWLIKIVCVRSGCGKHGSQSNIGPPLDSLALFSRTGSDSNGSGCCDRRFCINWQYSSLISSSTALRLSCLATIPVVPLPANGSSTTSPSLLPILMQRSTSCSGNIAMCFSLWGIVGMLQTSRRLRVGLNGNRWPTSVGFPNA